MHFSSFLCVTERWGPCFISLPGLLCHLRVGSVGIGLRSYQCAGCLDSPAPPRQQEYIWYGRHPQARPRTRPQLQTPLGCAPGLGPVCVVCMLVCTWRTPHKQIWSDHGPSLVALTKPYL